MWHEKCPYCGNATTGRYATTPHGGYVMGCCACGRAVAEGHLHTHNLFLGRASDEPLLLVTPDIPQIPVAPPPAAGYSPLHSSDASAGAEDPFVTTGFITAFSAWSLERAPVMLRGASSFAGHLAELERALDCSSSSSSSSSASSSCSEKGRKGGEICKDGGGRGPMVSVDQLGAYLHILDVSSILRLDHHIVDHAFKLFKDYCTKACFGSRFVQPLATAALVHAIREAQEHRTLQEVSIASNLSQKEIVRYIKILGKSLQLSQPINSNSIAVYMPRFCSLLQLNSSTQELAAHIGEVVVKKCFCEHRNPMSISAAAIFLACQLEDVPKTLAEVCKVTGLSEITIRKAHKELFENLDDLLPPDYTPAVPQESVFPVPLTTIAARACAPIVGGGANPLHSNTNDQEADKRSTTDGGHSLASAHAFDLNQPASWQPPVIFGKPMPLSGEANKPDGDGFIDLNEMSSSLPESEQRGVSAESREDHTAAAAAVAASWVGQSSTSMSSEAAPTLWQYSAAPPGVAGFPGIGSRNVGDDFNSYCGDGK